MAYAPLIRFLSKIGGKLFGQEATPENSIDFIESRIKEFSGLFPYATRLEWMMFARELADQSYRDGFRAGYEWNETELDRIEIEPEKMADVMFPDWREIPYDLNAIVPETYQESKHAQDAFRRYTGRNLGSRL